MNQPFHSFSPLSTNFQREQVIYPAFGFTVKRTFGKPLPVLLIYLRERFPKNQDTLLPIYKVQLNGYALIAEKCGLKPVTGIGLLYYEPQTDAAADIDQALLDEGFAMPFKAYLHELELKPEEMVMPLLKKVRAIADLTEPPIGNAGCADCQKLEDLIQLAAGQ
ncbi:hypothetical protein ACFL1G_09410 [Planctomycetota bacterium]